MSLLECVKGAVAVASGSTILVSPSPDRNIATLEIPPLPLRQPQPQSSKSSEDESRITALGVCGCPTLHVAACSGQKQLYLWSGGESGAFTLLRSVEIHRNALCIRFHPTCNCLFLGDKSGDVYLYDMNESTNPETPILGHLSMLLDMAIPESGNFVITCDRDEQIRVSNYPRSYNIESFCLGHTEAVTCLALLPSHPDWLLSGSLDGTVRLWEFITGTQLQVADVEKRVKASNSCGDVRFGVKDIQASEEDFIAVLLFSAPCVMLYSLKSGLLQHHHSIQLKSAPWGSAFYTTNQLIVSQPVLNQHLNLYEFTLDTETFSKTTTPSHLETIASNSAFFEASNSAPDLTPMLRKNQYDNVSEYFKKKEERISQQKEGRKRIKADEPTTS